MRKGLVEVDLILVKAAPFGPAQAVTSGDGRAL